jgi:hypothetical protein
MATKMLNYFCDLKNKQKTIVQPKWKCLISSITITTLLCSCASTTQINSIPSGANVYVGKEKVGQTPYTYRDTRIIGSDVMLKLTKSGHEDFKVAFSRDEEADIVPIVSGVFLFVPLLWAMKYKPEHTYELISIAPQAAPVAPYQTDLSPLIPEKPSVKKRNKKKVKALQQQ